MYQCLKRTQQFKIDVHRIIRSKLCKQFMEKTLNIWKLNYKILNNIWVKGKKEILKYFNQVKMKLDLFKIYGVWQKQ